MKSKILIFAVLWVFCERPSWAQLTVSGVRCGSKSCTVLEYCDFDNQCRPCAEICNKDHHNYQESTCVKGCQDYLHDARFVRKNGSLVGEEEDLRMVVQRLQRLVTVTLTLTCITLTILLVTVTLQICKWKKDNNITFASLRGKLSSSKKSNDKPNEANQGISKSDLRLDMPTTRTHSDNSPATVTTAISRRPAEDSALDYAYDNHAMSSSPSPNSKPPGSNF